MEQPTENHNAGDNEEFTTQVNRFAPSGKNLHRSTHWRWIYFFIGTISAIGLTTIYFFARRPHNPEKPKVPATKSEFVLVISKLNQTLVDSICNDIRERVKGDTNITKMVTGNSLIYKRCKTYKEFVSLTREGAVKSRLMSTGIQAYLLAQMMGLVTQDGLPTHFTLAGNIDTVHFDKSRTRIARSIEAMALRHLTIGPMFITLRLQPKESFAVKEIERLLRENEIPFESL